MSEENKTEYVKGSGRNRGKGGIKPYLLKIGGINSLSTIDYPNEVSYIIFFSGCNMSCPYCHNHDLKWNRTFTHQSIIYDLRQRKGLITAVVFSGGEALLQPYNSLVKLAEEIKSMGLKIGLHTNGSSSHKLKMFLPYVDWVGLDIKTALDSRYDKLTGLKNSFAFVENSLKNIIKSGVEYELRLTWDKERIKITDIMDAQKRVAELGGKEIIIQTCRGI